MKLSAAKLRAFSRNFDRTYEEEALASRGYFLHLFPLHILKDLTVEQYVIGKGTPSFCSLAEVRTKAWANMQGATASKFGIYFGRTKSDPDKKYRFVQRFGASPSEAFRSVKAELLHLVAAGERMDFDAIDKNSLSQMFRAKVLSLYFPEKFINICSAEHLAELASHLGLQKGLLASQYQHQLLSEKTESPTTRDWTNPKFMSFLYTEYLPKGAPPAPNRVVPPTSSQKKEVDFAALQVAWGKIGELSEEFALQWERNRLLGLGKSQLADRIKDRRKFPSYGYDFLSFTSEIEERYIEVKSLGGHTSDGPRFFLSENERKVSLSEKHASGYYFYLVSFGSDGKPRDLLAVPASRVYNAAELQAYVYLVRLGMEHGPAS